MKMSENRIESFHKRKFEHESKHCPSKRSKVIEISDEEIESIEDEEELDYDPEEYLIIGIDPGTRYGGIVCTNIVTRRIVSAHPFDLCDFLPEMAKKTLKDEVIPGCISVLLQREPFKSLFYSEKCPVVFIEQQLDPRVTRLASSVHLRAVQTSFEAILHGRIHISNPKSLRNHFETTVKAKELKLNSKQSYIIRKRKSEQVAEKVIHPEDLKKLYEVATEYWKNTKSMESSTLKRSIDKCYNDLLEAALITLYPGNWVTAKRKHGMPSKLSRKVEELLSTHKTLKARNSRQRRAPRPYKPRGSYKNRRPVKRKNRVYYDMPDEFSVYGNHRHAARDVYKITAKKSYYKK